jgi:hypothetical protein
MLKVQLIHQFQLPSHLNQLPELEQNIEKNHPVRHRVQTQHTSASAIMAISDKPAPTSCNKHCKQNKIANAGRGTRSTGRPNTMEMEKRTVALPDSSGVRGSINTNHNRLCARPLSPSVNFASRFVRQCFLLKKNPCTSVFFRLCIRVGWPARISKQTEP